MTREDTDIACGSCRACCKGDAIVLHPEHGDDPSQYEVEPMPLRLQSTIDAHFGVGRPRAVKLKSAENGDCIYLDRQSGCTIYERRPAICRSFNCAKMVDQLGLNGIGEAARKGFVSRDVIVAGIERLPRPARRRMLKALSERKVAS